MGFFQALTRYLKAFRIWLRIRGNIHDFYCGELTLPVLFTTESCNSSYRSQRGVTNVGIFCRNSGLPFNAGSRYSLHCLIQRIMTPSIVYSGESLTTAGVFI